MKQLYIRLAALVLLVGGGMRSASAQVLPDAYFNIDWQAGIPLGTHFADKFSGWGMNFEGGYFLTDAITIGGFINYQTNFEKVPRQTLALKDGNALTTSQKHAIFQLPFGADRLRASHRSEYHSKHPLSGNAPADQGYQSKMSIEEKQERT